MDVEVCIVGAGLAGLACARTLTQAGVETVVIDASDAVGGRLRTDEIDGHLVDRGYQVLLTAYPEVRRQLDIEALDLCAFQPGAGVWTGERFERLLDPRRAPLTIPASSVASIGSPLDKLRALKWALDVTRSDPRDLLTAPDRTTLTELQRRGFSPSMREQFLRPLLGGILLDPTLSVSARRAEIILRMLATGDAAVPAGGMERIPEQLAAALDPDMIRLGQHVAEINNTEIRVGGGDTIRAHQVVVATDGPSAARLLGLKNPGSAAVSCVWMAIDGVPSDAQTILLDGTASGPALNVAIMSNISPAYAPPGRSVVAAAIPGLAPPDVSESVRSQLSTWLNTSPSDWDHLATQRIPHGHPAQLTGSPVKRAVRLGNHRYVCGDHRDTASIQGALFSGRRTAAAVLADR